MKPIRLEDDWEPSWDDAKTRLKVAAETFGFPFHIHMDETAYACRGLQDWLEDVEEKNEEATYGDSQHFQDYSVVVNSWEEALRALYPWFHDGEEMPT